jgi:hypothetical protein
MLVVLENDTPCRKTAGKGGLTGHSDIGFRGYPELLR